MNSHSIYFGKDEIYEKIRNLGSKWNDSKERPIVCLVESKKHKGIFWAIPIGNLNHRDAEAQRRIQDYINRDSKSITSCYYHVGNTNVKSIFFISDVIPITKKYIDRGYTGANNQTYVIKNKVLLSELERKLTRILNYELANPNYFRQHITDILNELIKENKNTTP